VCVTYHGNGQSGLVAVDAVTGKQTVVFESAEEFIDQIAWLPDNSGLLAVYYGKGANFYREQISEISLGDRTARAVTHDLNDYYGLSISADGRILATVLRQHHFDLFVTSSSDLGSGQAQQLTSGAGAYNFAWTVDGQVILGEPQADLSLFRPGTGTKTPLTSPQQDGAAIHPCACANGRYILFSMLARGDATRINIWRMDAGGGNLKQITQGQEDYYPVCSPDGQFVYYLDRPNARLNRVSVEGGKAERLSEISAYGAFDISPDGKVSAFRTVSGIKKQLALMPVDSPQNTKLVELQQSASFDGAVRFTHDGKAVVYTLADQDSANLWLQPLDGSPGRQLTNFKSEEIIDFQWSFDGSKLGLIRGHTDADVVLLEDSKP
jgi:eukaryotic-like serine/threonine-protein kinase